MLRAFFITSSILFFTFSLRAQNSDTSKINVKVDSAKTVVDTFYFNHRANRAALFSAVLPGLGQVYNKKYWKLPILYGGFFALGYSIDFNNHYYHLFKDAYQARIKGDSTSDTYIKYKKIYPDDNSLLVRRDYYRRTRDLMWIITAGVYILNIIDAYVDAHLSNYDISDNLSMNAQPGLQFSFNKNPVPSLALTFTLK